MRHCKPEYQWQTGHVLRGIWRTLSDGAFIDQSAIDNETIDYSEVTTKLIPGDMKFVDYNKDGKINADDRVRWTRAMCQFQLRYHNEFPV
jgi:hypothetical protein